MSKAKLNVQDSFLNQMRKEGKKVVIKLMSGEEIEGVIKGFDNFCISLFEDRNQRLIYKHAIAYVYPKNYEK